LEPTVCNLCGADTPRLVYTNFGRDISRCRSCGHVYAGPERLTGWETWARYDESYFRNEYLPALGVVDDRVDLPACDARFARELSRMRPHRQIGTLLEIGSAAGLFLKSAERDGWQVTGVEIMEAGAEFARRHLGLNIISAPVEQANLTPAAYDIVAMFEVIEHLPDPAGVVGQLRNLLRPGGRLVISTPNIQSLTRAMLGGSWSVLNPGEHLHYFSEASLRRMLVDAGYDAVQFDRHYAGAGVYETMLPTHSFDLHSWRARTYSWLVGMCGRHARGLVQSLGLADGLHCMARRPAESSQPS